MAGKDLSPTRETNDLLANLRSAESLAEMEEISSEHGALEGVLLSHFTKFQNENVAGDDLFSLADALMKNGTRRIKKELDKRRKQLKRSSNSLLTCPSCGCVFEKPITLACGHTICLDCLQHGFITISGGCFDGKVISCYLCSGHQDSDGGSSVNVVLSEIIRKRFPEKAKQTEAKNLGKSHLLSNCSRAAVDSLSFALYISPKDCECLCLRSQAYSQLNLHYLALRDADNACKLRPDLPDAFHVKAKIFTKIKKYDDAVTEYLRCAVLAPTEHRRDEFIDSLSRLFTSHRITKVEQKIVAQKLANISITEEQFNEEIPTGTKDAVCPARNGCDSGEQGNFESSGERPKIDIDCLICVVCARLLFRPVTTQCGHTFCQECLRGSLEYGTNCQSCGKPLNDSYERKRKVTAVLDELARGNCEREYLQREKQHRETMDTWKRMGADQTVAIPILVGSIPIPCQRIQLILQDPTARNIVRRCIEWGSRMFGVCAPTQDAEKAFADHGTLLEIQATESCPDGNLSVRAIPKRMFLVLSRGVFDGCLVAKVEWREGANIFDRDTILQFKWRNAVSHIMLKKWLSTLPLDEKSCIENALGPMPPCESHLLLAPNGPSWLWWAMAALPFEPQEKLRILIMPSVIDRMQSIQKFLSLLLKLSKTRKRGHVNI